MAKIIAFVVNVIVLLTLFNEAIATRCTRVEHLRKSKKVNGDGGYRVLIDGEPKGYQPGKTYNGEFNLCFFHAKYLQMSFLFMKM